jgi:hypothetical protein
MSLILNLRARHVVVSVIEQSDTSKFHLNFNIVFQYINKIWHGLGQHPFVTIPRSVRLIMKNVSDKSCTEYQNTHFVFRNFFPPRKSCRLWDNVEKYCRAWQATDDNTKQALCMLRYLRLQTHTQNMWYLLFFHTNNGCTNAPQCYFERTLLVLFITM